MIVRWLLSGSFVITWGLLQACATKPAAENPTPVPPLVSKEGQKDKTAGTPPQAAAAPVVVPTTPADECIPSKVKQVPPFFLADQQVIVTRVAGACDAEGAQPGFQANASWMAMGFPCSGGFGKISYRDHYHNPKWVSFFLSNSCPMLPSDWDGVKKMGETVVGLSRTTKLMAYYPLAIVYWELPDSGDADLGSSIELRRQDAVEKVWPKFRDKKSTIRARVYGRENAWVKDNHFYAADIELINEGKEKFRIKVNQASVMDEEQIKEAIARCDKARPMHNCQDVFSR